MGTVCLVKVPGLLDHVVVQVGQYVVDPVVILDPEHFQLVYCVLVGQVWGRSIQIPAQVVAAEMQMCICT